MERVRGIARDSRLAVARLGLGTASRFFLLEKSLRRSMPQTKLRLK